MTGAFLPFQDQLAWLCAPRLWNAATPVAGAKPLSGAELALRIQAATGGQPRQAEGVYRYEAKTSLDVTEMGETAVWIISADGRELGFSPPTQGAPIDAFSGWADAIHQAEIFGWPFKMFVSAVGVVTSVLAVTGVLVWSKKRSARLLRAARRLSATAEAAGDDV